MRFLSSALACLLLVAASHAQMRIAGNTSYAPHSLVRLRAEGVDPKAGVHWRVHPSANVQRATTAEGLLEFAAPPASYEVELLAVTMSAEGKLRFDEAMATIVIGTAPPTPDVRPPVGQGKLDPVNAIAKIRIGNAGCTATVIGPRRTDGRWDLLTAAHCTDKAGEYGTATLKDGRTFRFKVLGRYAGVDLAWCVTEDVIPELPYANLSAKNPPVGTAIWHMGYGIDRPGNREDGKVTADENSEGQLKMHLSVSSGDSGGGIFRSDTNELVSVVCCTSGMGVRASMWGGCVEQALATRGRAVEFTAEKLEPVEKVQAVEALPGDTTLPWWASAGLFVLGIFSPAIAVQVKALLKIVLKLINPSPASPESPTAPEEDTDLQTRFPILGTLLKRIVDAAKSKFPTLTEEEAVERFAVQQVYYTHLELQREKEEASVGK